MAVTYTAQRVIELAQELAPMDPIRGLDLLNQAHLYITSQLHLIPDVTELITMVAGQAEYPLPDDVVAVWDAAYWAGGYVAAGSNYKPLKQTNVDTLFEDSGPNWQLRPASTPWGYYERGGNIGFVFTPSVASDQVQIFYTPATTLGITDTLPTNISSPYAWVYHMCYRAAAMPDKAGFKQLFEDEIHYLKEYILGRMGRDRARVSYRVRRVRKA
jgi:hypothetical protein